MIKIRLYFLLINRTLLTKVNNSTFLRHVTMFLTDFSLKCAMSCNDTKDDLYHEWFKTIFSNCLENFKGCLSIRFIGT